MSLSKKGRDRLVNKANQFGVTDNLHGIAWNGFLKPFTTSGYSLYTPHYTSSGALVELLFPSGNAGANVSGLNPYGINTLHDGLVFGDPASTGIQIPDPNNIRTYGFKNPVQIVGWGYDIFGYPVPNANANWDASGNFASTTGAIEFAGTGNAPVEHGSKVPLVNWKAGPLDLRWDQHRGCWAGHNGGVMAGVVRNTLISGSADNFDIDTAYYAEDVTYDIESYDGVANKIQLTGVIHIGPKPLAETYKIRPLTSGDFCFLVHHAVNNQPGFAVWLIEPPSSEACDNIAGGSDNPDDPPPPVGGATYGGPTDGEPWLTTGILDGTGLFAGLSQFNLPFQFGGLGFNSINNGEIIVGNASGEPEAKTFSAGSGISVLNSGSTFQISFSTGVAFSEGGVNTTITELQGLSTPLTIAQGGTGASSKIFVDLTTSQSVEGLKTFASGLRAYSGSINNPSISFQNNTKAGFSVPSGRLDLVVANSGIELGTFNTSGITLGSEVLIYNSQVTPDPDIQKASLTIRTPVAQPTGGPGTFALRVEDQINQTLSAIDHTGRTHSRFFHTTGMYDYEVPLRIEGPENPTQHPIRIFASGTERIRFDSSGDTLRLAMHNAGGGGFLKMAGSGDFSAGYLDLSANEITDLPGGNVITKGGGSLDTASGYLGLGPSGSQIIIKKEVGAEGNSVLTVPSGDGTIATREYVQSNATTTDLFESGISDTIIEGNTTFIFTSGILTSVSQVAGP